MGRTVLGELRKLLHPVAAIAIVICFAYILTDARTTYQYSRLQTPVAVVAGGEITTQAASCLGGTVAAISSQCQQKLDDAALNDHFASNGIALGRVTNSLSTWPGMLRFVSHQLATGLGWMLLAVLLGLHVAGEWSSRTAASTLVATSSHRRFWLAKIVSIWLSVVAVSLAGTTVLWLARSTYLGKSGIPDPINQSGDSLTWHLATLRPDQAWSSWFGSIGVLGIASLIWLLLISAGVAVAASVRRTILTVVVWLAVLSVTLSLARYAHLTTNSPISAISAILRLNQTPFGVRDTRLWNVSGAPAFIQDAVPTSVIEPIQVLIWAGVALMITVVGYVGFQRRRVIG